MHSDVLRQYITARVRPGDVLLPWECITQTLVLFRDKAKPRSGFNLITAQMIVQRQQHVDAEMLAPCGNMSCDSGAVESHHSVPQEEVPYFKGMVIFQRNIGGRFQELWRVVRLCAGTPEQQSRDVMVQVGHWDLSGRLWIQPACKCFCWFWYNDVMRNLERWFCSFLGLFYTDAIKKNLEKTGH